MLLLVSHVTYHVVCFNQPEEIEDDDEEEEDEPEEGFARLVDKGQSANVNELVHCTEYYYAVTTHTH